MLTGPAPIEEPRDRTAVTRLVMDVWREVLETDRLGEDDDFFEVGGNSLLAVQMIGRLSALVGVELSLEAMVDRPTVRGLVAEVEGLTGGAGPQPAALGPGRPDGVPSPLQQRLGRDGTHHTAAVRLRGELDLDRLATALAAVLQRHDTLRTSFVDVAGRLEAVAAAPAAGLTVEPAPPGEEAVAAEVAAEAARSFPPGPAPLVRVRALRIGPCDHVLLVSAGELVADRPSLVRMGRELSQLYAGAEVPALPLQHADFAAWQRERERTRAAGDALARWEREAEGAVAALDPPGDGAPAGGAAPIVSRHPLAPFLGEAARRLAQALGLTPAAVLLGTLGAAFRRRVAPADLVVGIAVPGRSRPAVDPLIGCVETVLPFRLSGGARFLDMARAVQGVLTAEPAAVPPRLAAGGVRLRQQVGHALPLRLPGVVADEVPAPGRPPGGAALEVTVVEAADAFRLDWVADPSAMTAASVERLVTDHARLVPVLLQAPDSPI